MIIPSLGFMLIGVTPEGGVAESVIAFIALTAVARVSFKAVDGTPPKLTRCEPDIKLLLPPIKRGSVLKNAMEP